MKHRNLSLLFLLLTLFISSVVFPHTLAAVSGILDTSFNGSGVATTPLGYGASVAVQADGKIVVAGSIGAYTSSRFALARYTPNGILDTTFGPNANGTLTTLIGSYGGASGVAIQSDGKIVVAGDAVVSGAFNFALARYTISGVLDTTFGPNANGTLKTLIGAGAIAYGVAIQSDGKIVAAGGSSGGNFALARYTTSGVLDSGFGSSGVVTTLIGSYAYGAYGVAIQSDGKIVAAGKASVSLVDNFALARYTSAGVLDTTFGSSGTQTTLIGTSADANGVAIQSDGKIVAAGTATVSSVQNLALARYTSAGVLDTTFGSSGTQTTLIGTSANANGLAIQSNGKIVAAGYAVVSGAFNFALARYTISGVLDTTFGLNANGTLKTLIGTSADAYGVAIQSDGKIVAAGTAGSTNFGFAVARYTGDSTDITPPTWPAGSALAASIVNSSTILLSWTPATDNVGVTSYKVYQGSSLIATLSGTAYSYPATRLTTGTTYTFNVQASDAANNTSTNGPSTSVRIPTTTSASAVGPSAILSLSILIASMTALVKVSKRSKKPTNSGTPSPK